MKKRKSRHTLIIVAIILCMNSIGYSALASTLSPEYSDEVWNEHILFVTKERIEQITAVPSPTPVPEPEPEPTPKPIPEYEQIVDIAEKYLGVPYVWGGTTPDGFDCSGLVQDVYCQMGYSLSRTTYTQVNEGTYISYDNLRCGDVVFFGDSESPHHVGIYVGNGEYIHAPLTGEVVKISELSSRSDYATARRIIN